MRADRWLPLAEVAALLGLSERYVLKLRATRGLPLRRASLKATPGAFESEVFSWLKRQPWPGGR